ncbi:MAG: hypothetical protein QGG05_06935 [Candidatus Latescibacteria bacterium]|nr:hypothetical protein [Candidatus Latescibacterota bacterium]
MLRRDYRPTEARKITQAYRGETKGVWEGYQGPFEGVDDPEERSALHRLLIRYLKYRPIGGTDRVGAGAPSREMATAGGRLDPEGPQREEVDR